MCMRTLGKGIRHSNFRVVVNRVEEECGVGSDVPETFCILFFKKERVIGCKYGKICLISVNPWVYVLCYFLYFLCV